MPVSKTKSFIQLESENSSIEDSMPSKNKADDYAMVRDRYGFLIPVPKNKTK